MEKTQQNEAGAATLHGVSVFGSELVHPKILVALETVLGFEKGSYEINAVCYVRDQHPEGKVGLWEPSTKMILVYMASLLDACVDNCMNSMTGMAVLADCWTNLIFVQNHEIAHAIATKNSNDEELNEEEKASLEEDCNHYGADMFATLVDDNSIDVEVPPFNEIPYLPQLFVNWIALKASDENLQAWCGKQMELYDKNAVFDEEVDKITSMKDFLTRCPNIARRPENEKTKVEMASPQDEPTLLPAIIEQQDPFLQTEEVAVEKKVETSGPQLEATPVGDDDEALADMYASMNGDAFFNSADAIPIPAPERATPETTDPSPTAEPAYQTLYKALAEHIWKHCRPENPAGGAWNAVKNGVKIDDGVLAAVGVTKFTTVDGNCKWHDLPVQNGTLFPMRYPEIKKDGSRGTGLPLFRLHLNVGLTMKVIAQNPLKPGSQNSALAQQGNRICWVVQEVQEGNDVWRGKIVNGTYERIAK